ncbi:MAG: bifunctional proline dehydrogenase/L-glutamate gamma-semialdehyde dehydrogenase, partial [Rhizobiales bacterium]|nr:bifunctional proline dehydrogenase/L-glutamate gamma-semialdehyde dehydrogenase [Hyphomicrobiales bacterium]
MTQDLKSKIDANVLRDEGEVARALLEKARPSPNEKAETERLARRLVHAVRKGRRPQGGVDAFMQEYSLSSEEGVVLMCLAEALLRIPDADTADKLIADKIGGRDWNEHFGHSDSLFVNASTWGLMLTGRVVDLGRDTTGDASGFLGNLVKQSGEPIIRQAMRHAMRIMGKQFVLGRTIKEALQIAAEDEKQGYRHSFDMLGEAAMTADDAERYFQSYRDALLATAANAGTSQDKDVFARPSISIKLSALHPRYEPRKKDDLERELLPRLVEVCTLAKEHNLGVTIDAEEADKLELSLELFKQLAEDKSLTGWNGLGLAVQAYGRRACPTLEWL